jgi:hypothetical protein
VGFESFQTFSVLAKVTRDISRKELKEKKFLFLSLKEKPIKQELSFPAQSISHE